MKTIFRINKEALSKIIFLTLFWVIVATFIIFYDWAILVSDPESASFGENSYTSHIPQTLISTLIVTVVGGLFIASIEVMYFSRLLRKKPFGLSILIKTAFYMANIIVFTSLGFLIGTSMIQKLPLFHPESLNDYVEYVFSPRNISIWIFWGMAVMIALFILQVSEKLGQGVLINFLLGRYHRPREVDRIFMFLDLKSSTTYAEKLGHVRYSELIQDCFYDLTDVVAKHQAQIYQYVGDEAVLLWNVAPGLKNQNCVNSFFSFGHAIEEKKEYYQQKYAMVPEFKAGLDFGRVTVAEVGEIKKELAYHGDVLNTASRITGRCNDLGENILISERLKEQLRDPLVTDRFEQIGEVQLKGKANPVNIFRVNPVFI